MNVRFSKVSRGPAWERWVVIEDQNGEEVFAGEAIITYSDASSFADSECDILYTRDLSDEEVDTLLDAASAIISDSGNITVYHAKELLTKQFSFACDHEDEEEDQEPWS